jgi:hypothetical protein
MELVDNPHERYLCTNCGESFNGEPVKGHWFRVSDHHGHITDSDGDPFIPGDITFLKGVPAYSCANGCYIDEEDFEAVMCQKWVCECGTEYSFDNDHCGVHAYSSKQDAKMAAQRCDCGTNSKKEQEKRAEDECPLKPGDLVRATVRNPEGATLEKGQLVKISSVEAKLENGNWRTIVLVVDDNHVETGRSWFVDSNHLELHYDEQEQAVLDALTRKEAPEKKVTYIDW